MRTQYKIGDRVIARHSFASLGTQIKKGDTGTVINAYAEFGALHICVEFDKPHPKMHDGNAIRGTNGKSGCCWWFDRGLDVHFAINKPCDKKIVITTDGVETLARLYENGKVVKKATAKCSPEDEFDFNVGAKYAFERLAEPAAEKKEEYYNGKVVCVKVNSNPGIYTAGKIYQFVDGRFIDDTGNQMPRRRQMKDFKEWQKYSASEFIEIKE